MATIHPSAVVGENAKLADDVVIGPQCVIEEDIEIGSGTVVGPACLIWSKTKIGSNNRFYAHCSIGGDSQDKKGCEGSLEIGDNNTVREFATINCATGAANTTKVGSSNWLMTYSHIAHECVVGNNTVIGNLVQLGGHVTVDDGAILGGCALVHQNCRVGELAIIGANTITIKDVPPFAKYALMPGGYAVAVNKIALERANRSDEIDQINDAYRVLYREGLSLDEALERIKEMATKNKCLVTLVNFLAKKSKCGIVRPRRYVSK